MVDRVAGVLLAAGTSSRMGTNKLLLPWGGRAVIARVAGAAVAAGLNPLFVVVGHEADRVRAALAGLPVTFVPNPGYAAGIVGSLRTGMAAVPDDVPATITLLGDMPLVTPAMIAELVARARAGADLVVSSYGGELAPPFLYGSRFYPELRTLDGEGCGKKVIKRHRAEAVEVAWPASAVRDLDEPADVAILGGAHP
jgi:molybdenum cofactor cytidylyltransferase